MTDHEGNRKPILLEGFRRAWKQMTFARGEAKGNTCSQLFLGPTESREQDGFFCWLRSQSLFISLYHYMPTVHKIAIHNKFTKMSKFKIQNLIQIVGLVESFQFAHKLYVIFISYMQLHFLKVINIIILTKIIKIGRAGNNVLSKYKRQTGTSL